MKTSIVCIVLVLGIGTRIDARPRPADAVSSFEANKTFGLGLELGEPSALNGKYFYSANRAIDFGLGDIYDYGGYRGLYLYADHEWHPVSLTHQAAFELPLYIGVGASLWSWEDYRLGPVGPVYNGNALGVRAPIGIMFDFNNTPLDIFIQVVPTLALFADAPNGYDRNTYFTIHASVGLRYWFK
jgi:hypothetical protein